MKKKAIKILAGIMSVVILCISMSVGAFAVGAVIKSEIDDLWGCYAYEVVPSESGSSVLVKTYTDDYDQKYAITTNGKDYNVFYADELSDADYAEFVDVTVKGETFVILIHNYVEVEYYDEESEEYYYDYDFDNFEFVTTDDGINFESYYFEVDYSIGEIYPDVSSYYSKGVIGFIGDTFIFANCDYYEYEEDGEWYNKGVYYTTKDFETWDVHYAEPMPMWLNGESTYYTGYRIAGNNLIIEHYYNFYYFDDDNESEMDTWLLDTVEITTDFENYKEIWNRGGSYILYENVYGVLENHPDEIFIQQAVYPYGYTHGEYVIDGSILYSYNLKTNREKLIYEAEGDGYLSVSFLDDWMFIEKVSYPFEEGFILSQLIYTNESEIGQLAVYDTEFTYCYALNNTVYAMDSYGFNIIEDTYFKSYDLSDTSIDLYNSMAFELDGKIFVLEAPGETKVNLYTLADKSDRFTYMGDVDNDEWVTSSDALMALQYSTGVKPLTSAQCRRADVTGDDKINSSDALLMLKYSTGLVPQP